MALPEAFLEELKARVPLADIVGRRVRLLRSARDLKGCCPFHNEKTPSFHVYPDHYHCFGCGAHGDAIRFLMETEGHDFMAAVRALAAEAGMDVPESRPDPQARARAGLAELVAAAEAWFVDRLESASGAAARRYLAGRGLPPALVADHRLGFAPESGLASHLRKTFPDAPVADMVAAGLLLESDDGRLRDRFRNRLIIPIRDARGRTVGFGGRLIEPGEPKYLNSSDGPLFHKGRLLFHLDRAAAPARKAGRLFIVEGYMDVLGLVRAGISEAVAPLGTALTEEQIRLAWRVVDEPILAFDGDAAGLRAAERAATRALPLLGPGRSLRFLLLPPGKDPDDITREGGAEAFEALARDSLPLDRFLFGQVAAAMPRDTPERRAAFRRRLDELAGLVPHAGLASDYRRTFQARADALTGNDPARTGRSPRRGPRDRGPLRQPAHQAPLAATRARARAGSPTLAMLLKAFALHPEAVERHAEALGQVDIDDPRLRAARDALLAGATGPALALKDMPPLGGDCSGEAFDRLAGAALASLLSLPHLPPAARTSCDFAGDESIEQAYARASLRRTARADRLDRLKAQALDPGQEAGALAAGSDEAGH